MDDSDIDLSKIPLDFPYYDPPRLPRSMLGLAVYDFLQKATPEKANEFEQLVTKAIENLLKTL